MTTPIWMGGACDTRQDASLAAAGSWGQTLSGWRSAQLRPWAMALAAPTAQWYGGNVPPSGAMLPVPGGFIANSQTRAWLSVPMIGPYDTTLAASAALQQALATAMARLQPGG